MGEIAYPLRRRMRGRQVAELQLTLGALLDAGAVGGKASEELRGPLEAERKRSAFGPTTERMVTLFQQRLGEMTSPWWEWNCAVEVVVPGVSAPEASRATQLRHQYYRLVREAAASDRELWKAVLEVNQAVSEPSKLMHPSIMWRVLRQQAQPRAPMGLDERELVGTKS